MAAVDLLSSLRTAVDRASYVPYYIQVKEAVRELIEHRGWAPGEQILGESELCQVCGVSRTVIRQALGELKYEVLIICA